jgi:hypothetical protein
LRSGIFAELRFLEVESFGFENRAHCANVGLAGKGVRAGSSAVAREKKLRGIEPREVCKEKGHPE